MKTDLYQKVTDQIVSSLEQGVRPWMKPWSAEHAAGRIMRPLRANGIAYQDINVLVLWCAAVTKGYGAPIWMTFRQALELGACVRKGEHGSTVVYASTFTRTGTDQETGEESEQAVQFLKSYTVFNVEQIEGLPAQFHALAEPRLDPVQRIERAESFFTATRAAIRHGGSMAYYNIGADFVQLPPFEAFRDAESYYATLAHECTHWTRHKSPGFPLLAMTADLLAQNQATGPAAGRVLAQTTGLDAIQHVIVIYQENWSFDGLYGKFSGADGIANAGDRVKQISSAR
jgi:antirestriction protein ArdC